MRKISMIILSMTFAVLCLGESVSPATTGNKEIKVGQQEQSFRAAITGQGQMDYLFYVPEAYTETQTQWPLVLFLHGAGERGSDLNMLKKHGLPKRIARGGKSFPFFVVSPQCPKDAWWSSEKQLEILDALLDDLVARYRIDEERIYVTGLSMGGYGTWGLALKHPDRFAAIAPICGGGDPEHAGRIAHLPIWVFHGAKDTTVPLKKSEEMVTALKQEGSSVKFTVYPEAGHDSWTATYKNPELYAWLLKHRRAGKK